MVGFNVSERVEMRGGWVGLFTGESQGRALQRVLPQLNKRGYCVVEVVEDKWSLARRLLNLIVAIATLGFVVGVPNLMIIAETHMGP